MLIADVSMTSLVLATPHSSLITPSLCLTRLWYILLAVGIVVVISIMAHRIAAIIVLSAVAVNIVCIDGFPTAVPTISSYKSQQHRQRSSKIKIFSLKEDTTTSSIADNTGRSSSLRSTSQTDALGRQQIKQDTDEDEETNNIPTDVLQSFTLLILSQFVLFLGVGAVIPAIPLYGQSIGLSSASNGIVISTPAVALLLCSRFAGEFADVKRKPAMMIGMAIIAISDAGTAFSNNLATLVVARLGLGLGRGYAEAGERGMLTDLANKAPNLRGRALAIQQASVALGVAIGAPAGGLIVENYGVRSSFLCGKYGSSKYCVFFRFAQKLTILFAPVSVAAVIALFIYALLPETVVIEIQTDDKSTPIKEDRTSADKADWIELLKTSQTWRSLAVCQSGVSVGYACKIAIIPILASQILGGATGAGILLSAAGLSGLVG